MLTKDYPNSYAIPFGLFLDKSKAFGVVPMPLIRWVVPAALAIPAVTFLLDSRWILAFISTGILLVVMLAFYLQSVLLARYQLSQKRRLYQEFRSDLGLPMLEDPTMYSSMTSEAKRRAKTQLAKNRKILRNSVVMRWNKRTLLGFRFITEGGKLNRRNAADIISWISTAQKPPAGTAYVILNPEQCSQGVLTLEIMDKKSTDYIEQMLSNKVYEIVHSVSSMGVDDWPEIKLNGLDTVNYPEPRFDSVEMKVKNREIDSKYAAEKILNLMTKAFPLEETKVWRLTQDRSDELRIFVDEVKGEEIYGEKYARVITHIIDSSKKSIDPEGREAFFIYDVTDLVFEGPTEKVLSFSVKFRNVGRLVEDELLSRFQIGIAKLVGKNIGGEWDSEDLIFKSSEVVFRRIG